MLKRNTSLFLLASTALVITQNVQAKMPGFYAGAHSWAMPTLTLIPLI